MDGLPIAQTRTHLDRHADPRADRHADPRADRHTDPRAAVQTELEQLRQENAILRQTLDAIDGSVVVYDADHRFVLANKAYHDAQPHIPANLSLIGRRYEEVVRRSIDARRITDPLAGIDRDAFIRDRRRIFYDPNPTPFESYDAASGRWHLVRVRRTDDGHRVSLRVDITEQKRLQQALEQARATAEQASLGKSHFLANISHELRTPLNAVINFGRLLSDEIHGKLIPPDYLSYAQNICESGTHLQELIEELLDFARADAGRLTLTDKAVNLRALLASVVRLLQPEAQLAQISLRAAVPADLPPVRGDNTRLRQILFNLLTNAIQYTGPGGRVALSTRVLPHGALEIAIADNGPGIAAADLARVMLPFERAVDGTSSRHRGMGLGLALANHLVTLHGGVLTLDSAPGAGTTARVALPAGRVLSAA